MKKLLAKILTKIGLLNFVKRIRKSINYDFNIVVNETRLKGLRIYSAKTENSEKWMGQLLNILLPLKQGPFIDVGVNIGQTLMQVKSIEFEKIYFGFEPNPSCNMFVEELIRINRFPNVKIIPTGLFTENSLLELDLYYDDLTNSGGSVIKDYWAFNNIKPRRSIIVPLMDFATINKSIKIDSFGIVKIDVEGAELEVLESIYAQIDTFKPIIIIEILSAYSEENNIRIARQNSILTLIQKLDYLIFRIIEDKNSRLDYLQEIEFFDPRYNKDFCNYVLIHKSESELIDKYFKTN